MKTIVHVKEMILSHRHIVEPDHTTSYVTFQGQGAELVLFFWNLEDLDSTIKSLKALKEEMESK